MTQLASDTAEKLNVFIELIYDKVLSQRGERYVNFHFWLHEIKGEEVFNRGAEKDMNLNSVTEFFTWLHN